MTLRSTYLEQLQCVQVPSYTRGRCRAARAKEQCTLSGSSARIQAASRTPRRRNPFKSKLFFSIISFQITSQQTEQDEFFSRIWLEISTYNHGCCNNKDFLCSLITVGMSAMFSLAIGGGPVPSMWFSN